MAAACSSPQAGYLSPMETITVLEEVRVRISFHEEQRGEYEQLKPFEERVPEDIGKDGEQGS